MKTFKDWWNSSATAVDDHPRRVAEAAWNFAYGMQNERIRKMDAELKESQQKHLDSIRALRRANEQITSIAKDNGKLRTELASYQEPTEERAVKYIATVNEVCEDEADAFYMGTLDDIMEWCEDQFLTVNSLKFYRLGDEIRVGFCDLGKETRFKNV